MCATKCICISVSYSISPYTIGAEVAEIGLGVAADLSCWSWPAMWIMHVSSCSMVPWTLSWRYEASYQTATQQTARDMTNLAGPRLFTAQHMLAQC